MRPKCPSCGKDFIFYVENVNNFWDLQLDLKEKEVSLNIITDSFPNENEFPPHVECFSCQKIFGNLEQFRNSLYENSTT